MHEVHTQTRTKQKLKKRIFRKRSIKYTIDSKLPVATPPIKLEKNCWEKVKSLMMKKKEQRQIAMCERIYTKKTKNWQKKKIE